MNHSNQIHSSQANQGGAKLDGALPKALALLVNAARAFNVASITSSLLVYVLTQTNAVESVNIAKIEGAMTEAQFLQILHHNPHLAAISTQVDLDHSDDITTHTKLIEDVLANQQALKSVHLGSNR